MNSQKKVHWEHIYATRQSHEVGWTQAVPATSLELIRRSGLPKSAHIIDVGGGDSTLVDFLIRDGYQHITVLDISANALDRAQKRLGQEAVKVHWVVTDILSFVPDQPFDLWHDRAAFHFLTTDDQIEKNVQIVTKSRCQYLVMATFSKKGPAKCSGLDICQYSQTDLEQVFQNQFDKIQCVTEDHFTPTGIAQNYTFCSFKRKST